MIGNFLTHAAWQNTIVEDYHAGRTNEPFLTPHQRRFSAKDERTLLSELCNNMLVVNGTIRWLYDTPPRSSHTLSKYLALYPESAAELYNSFYYLTDWSTTAYSSVVYL